MGSGLFSGTHIIIVLLVVLVLFGSAKLPGAARSLGKSMRILKAETKGLVGSDDDDEPEHAQPAQASAPTPQPAPAPKPAITQGQESADQATLREKAAKLREQAAMHEKAADLREQAERLERQAAASDPRQTS